MLEIRRYASLNAEELAPLLAAARQEGYRILDRLVEDWQSGFNRFGGPGEAYFGAYRDGRLVGVGGINRVDERSGRMRRVYVLPEERGRGVGSLIGHAAIEASGEAFDEIVLRSKYAGPFYERLGFTATGEENPTHVLRLKIED